MQKYQTKYQKRANIHIAPHEIVWFDKWSWALLIVFSPFDIIIKKKRRHIRSIIFKSINEKSNDALTFIECIIWLKCP
jgi:hypothetical protein